MFGKNKVVVAITKYKVIGAVVNTSKKQIKKSVEFGFDINTLDVVLSKIKSELKTKSIRILVGDELSYLLRLEIPADISKKERRSYISEKISEQIPEELSDKEWDYKQLSFGKGKDGKGDSKTTMVFSIVKDVFGVISSSVSKLGLNVVAIEPEALAKTRDNNPIIGLALKEDVKGEDEDVLNLEPLVVQRTEDDEEVGEDTKLLIDEAKELKKKSRSLDGDAESSDDEKEKDTSKKKPKSPIWIIVFLMAISLVVGLYAIFSKDIKNYISSLSEMFKSEQDQVEEVISSEPGAQEFVEEAEEKEEIDLTQYTIQVQNGSGVAGEAGYVIEILKAEGFTSMNAENADNYDYTDTEVSLGQDVPEEVFNTINRALNDEYSVKLLPDKLSEDSEYDAVLVVGERL